MVLPNLPTLIINNIKKLKITSMLDEEGIMSDGFLFKEFRRYNIHKIFAPIFSEHKDNKELAVIKSAFIVLAYSYNSTWINIDKDRYINKKEILSSLCTDSEIDIDEEVSDILLANQDETVNNSINHYIDFQKDDDFFTLIGLIEYISSCNRRAMSTDNQKTTDRELNDRGKFLEGLDDLNSKKDKLKKEIQSKYMNLDEVMIREGRQPITEQLDLSNYEARLVFINQKLKNGEVI